MSIRILIFITEGIYPDIGIRADTLVLYYLKQIKGRRMLDIRKENIYIPFLISGEIKGNICFDKDVYITGDIIIRDTLRIFAGAKLIFYDFDDQRHREFPYLTGEWSEEKTGIEIWEKIEAMGNEESPIHFKGIKDEYKLWTSVCIANKAKAEFKNCIFENAITGVYSMSNAGVFFTDCIFQKNGAGLAPVNGGYHYVKDSKFINNGFDSQSVVKKGSNRKKKEILAFKKGIEEPLRKIKKEKELIVSKNAEIDSMDGGIWLLNSNLRVENSEFINNKRDGILAQITVKDKFIEIRNSKFEGNYLSGVYIVLQGKSERVFEVNITGSKFYNQERGIHLVLGRDDTLNKGNILISGNTFKGNYFGFYSRSELKEKPDLFDYNLILNGNTFKKDTYGLYFERRFPVGNREIKVYLRGNIIIENDTGVAVMDTLYYTDAGRVDFNTGFNSFLGNGYHIANMRKDTFWAQKNLWSENTIEGIEAHLIDDTDNRNYGPVIFEPYALSGVVSGNVIWRGNIYVGGDIRVERNANLKIKDANVKIFPYDGEFSGIDTGRVEFIISGKFSAKRSNFDVIDSTEFGFFGIRTDTFRHYDNCRNDKMKNFDFEGCFPKIEIKRCSLINALYGLYLDRGKAKIKRSYFDKVLTGVYIKDEASLILKRNEIRSYDHAIFIDGFEKLNIKEGRNKFLPYEGYAIYNNSPIDIDAEMNYFGTMDIDSVEVLVYHKVDDSTKGFVDYIPLWDGEGGVC